MKAWWVCDKCWYSYSTFTCMRCSTTEKVEIPKIIKQVKEIKPDIIKKVIKEEVNNENINRDMFEWLNLYTASYLNHKLNKDLNSIKQEKICIKVWDKYILHEDIINKFNIDNWLVASVLED